MRASTYHRASYGRSSYRAPLSEAVSTLAFLLADFRQDAGTQTFALSTGQTITNGSTTGVDTEDVTFGGVQAAEFDGSNYLTVPDATLLALTNDFSLAFVAMPETGFAGRVRLIGTRNGTNGIGLFIQDTGLVGFTTFGIKDYTGGPTIPLDRPRLIGVTINTSNDAEFWINGALEATDPGTSPANPSTGSAAVFGAEGSGASFIGNGRFMGHEYLALAFEPALTAGQWAKLYRELQTETRSSFYVPDVYLKDARVENAATFLEIPTYAAAAAEGEHQTTHPDVLYFPDGWNGWKYWMIHTPYPDSQSAYENPSISVSNNRITWVTPDGLTNPIDTPSGGFYSDTDLLYNPGDDKLYAYWRQRDADERIWCSSSSDGVTWSAKTAVLISSTEMLLSPSVILDGSTYVMLYVSRAIAGTGDLTVKRRTCSTPDGTFGTATDTNITGAIVGGSQPWHVDRIKVGDKYLMMLNNLGFVVHLAKSDDDLTWTWESTPVIAKGETGAWDAARIYRPSMVAIERADGSYEYPIWYGGVSAANEWRIGYTTLELGI